ncbi:hypothetical protein [Bradyrhizobium guangxiense]|uniref:hypothetical protein n=1 Tax=Bradyrhizobium guangxiense TaxID=1325115 RepID=UPI0013E8E39C|nr:hypothetical protein [Bradyrhizobium guangxiense]
MISITSGENSALEKFFIAHAGRWCGPRLNAGKKWKFLRHSRRAGRAGPPPGYVTGW